MPPLSLGYIAAYLLAKVKDIDIRIASYGISSTLDSFKPDIVGVSSVSQNYNFAKKIAVICKKRSLPVIIGGQHISALPQSMTKDMDIAILREGEETFREIAQIFQKHGRDMEKIRKVKGIAVNGKLNPPRELITPLDRIPHPAYDLLELQKGGMFPVFSSRGCPYNCQFCSSTRFWNSVRYFSAEYVVEEIEMILKQYRPSMISFQDDLFVADRKRLDRIVALVRKKGIHKKVAFHVSCRANLVTDELVKTLKRMNVTNIGLGLESGCDRTLKWLKGNVTQEMNKKAVAIISRHQINVNATFIIGTPHETREDIMKTYRFIKNSPINLFQVYGLVPYPGTPVWNYALKRGLVSNDMDWEMLAQDFEHNPKKKLNLSEHLTKNEMLSLYRRFERLRKWKYTKTLAMNAARNPGEVVPYIRRKIWEHRAV